MQPGLQREEDFPEHFFEVASFQHLAVWFPGYVKNVNPSTSTVHLGQRFQPTSYAARGRQLRSRQLKLATTPLRQTQRKLVSP